MIYKVPGMEQKCLKICWGSLVPSTISVIQISITLVVKHNQMTTIRREYIFEEGVKWLHYSKHSTMLSIIDTRERQCISWMHRQYMRHVKAALSSKVHLGQCIGYDKVRRYHTDMATLTAEKNSNDIPIPSLFDTETFTTAFDHEEATLPWHSVSLISG